MLVYNCLLKSFLVFWLVDWSLFLVQNGMLKKNKKDDGLIRYDLL